MSSKEPIGDKDILKKRIVNRRYQDVKAVVETGYTAEVANFIRNRTTRLRRQPGEFFQRLRTSTVATNLQRQRMRTIFAPLEDGGYARPMDEYGSAPVGMLSVDEKKYEKVDLLLLDCRSVEDYEEYHILGALHYPRTLLNHSTCPFLPDMFAYKNKNGKYIVIYDFDESLAVQVANILCEKGIDNISIIAGGIQEFLYDYKDLVVGNPPPSIASRDILLQRRADQITLNRSEAKTVLSHKPKSLSNSLAKGHGRKV